MKKPKSYKVAWCNGYYETYTFIKASSEKQAIKIAKKKFGRGRSFSMGENPASNCGVYGEPIAILDATTEEKEIENKMIQDEASMNYMGY